MLDAAVNRIVDTLVGVPEWGFRACEPVHDLSERLPFFGKTEASQHEAESERRDVVVKTGDEFVERVVVRIAAAIAVEIAGDFPSGVWEAIQAVRVAMAADPQKRGRAKDVV